MSPRPPAAPLAAGLADLAALAPVDRRHLAKIAAQAGVTPAALVIGLAAEYLHIYREAAGALDGASLARPAALARKVAPCAAPR